MTYKATVLSDSPLAYWRLNETSGTTAADSSGNGHTATIASSGVTYNVAGKVTDSDSAAMTFDGAAGCVTLAGASFLPSGNSAWSFDYWAKLAGVSATQVLAAFGVGSTNEEPNNYVSGGNLIGSTWNTDFTVQAISAGTWYYVGTSYDGTTERVYVNGSLVASHAPGTVAIPASPTLAIGRNPSPSEYFAAATMQEVAFYGSALSASRFLAHYNAGIGTAITLGADALGPLAGPSPAGLIVARHLLAMPLGPLPGSAVAVAVSRRLAGVALGPLAGPSAAGLIVARPLDATPLGPLEGPRPATLYNGPMGQTVKTHHYWPHRGFGRGSGSLNG